MTLADSWHAYWQGYRDGGAIGACVGILIGVVTYWFVDPFNVPETPTTGSARVKLDRDGDPSP